MTQKHFSWNLRPVYTIMTYWNSIVLFCFFTKLRIQTEIFGGKKECRFHANTRNMKKHCCFPLGPKTGVVMVWHNTSPFIFWIPCCTVCNIHYITDIHVCRCFFANRNGCWRNFEAPFSATENIIPLQRDNQKWQMFTCLIQEKALWKSILYCHQEAQLLFNVT